MPTTEQTTTVPAPEPADVVRVVSDVGLDDAINRLAALQETERAVEAEKRKLREGVEFCMRFQGIDKYSTPEGHTATVYNQERTSVDWDYLKTILSPEAFAKAHKVSMTGSIRIR